MDEKEKTVMRHIFDDADADLFEILISKCIITVGPEERKESLKEEKDEKR